MDKIKKMEKIQPVRILIDKTEVDVNEAGVESGKVLDSRTEFVKGPMLLPDILAFLQRETELTRKTLPCNLPDSGLKARFCLKKASSGCLYIRSIMPWSMLSWPSVWYARKKALSTEDKPSRKES